MYKILKLHIIAFLVILILTSCATEQESDTDMLKGIMVKGGISISDTIEAYIDPLSDIVKDGYTKEEIPAVEALSHEFIIIMTATIEEIRESLKDKESHKGVSEYLTGIDYMEKAVDVIKDDPSLLKSGASDKFREYIEKCLDYTKEGIIKASTAQ